MSEHDDPESEPARSPNGQPVPEPAKTEHPAGDQARDNRENENPS
jgi:hypothetical protein